MTFEVVTYDAAVNTLSTTIAGGNPPDIVGPVGVGGIEGFHGQWLDLAPYLETAGFDLSIYPQEAVDFYNTEDGQIGLPFATTPPCSGTAAPCSMRPTLSTRRTPTAIPT